MPLICKMSKQGWRIELCKLSIIINLKCVSCSITIPNKHVLHLLASLLLSLGHVKFFLNSAPATDERKRLLLITTEAGARFEDEKEAAQWKLLTMETFKKWRCSTCIKRPFLKSTIGQLCKVQRDILPTYF